MRKYILIFFMFFFSCIIISYIVLHFSTQKNGLPPLSLEEIWNYKWTILFFSLIGGAMISFRIYVEEND